MKRSLFIIILTLILVVAFSVPCFASLGKNDPGYHKETSKLGDVVDGHMQYRYVTIVDTDWTKWKYVKGQPVNGYTLEKGANLFYYDVKGDTKDSITITAGAAYKAFSVSMSIPLGEGGNTKVKDGFVGIACEPVASKGKYKLRVKKNVRCTVKASQWRFVVYDGKEKKYVPVSGKNGEWGHTKIISPKYVTADFAYQQKKQ